jgi:hypothetical protein
MTDQSACFHLTWQRHQFPGLQKCVIVLPEIYALDFSIKSPHDGDQHIIVPPHVCVLQSDWSKQGHMTPDRLTVSLQNVLSPSCCYGTVVLSH